MNILIAKIQQQNKSLTKLQTVAPLKCKLNKNVKTLERFELVLYCIMRFTRNTKKGNRIRRVWGGGERGQDLQKSFHQKSLHRWS